MISISQGLMLLFAAMIIAGAVISFNGGYLVDSVIRRAAVLLSGQSRASATS